MIRKAFDRFQIALHLLGLHRLASLVGRFGTPTPPAPQPDDISDRPTLEVPVYIPPSDRGVSYCGQDDEGGPLQVLNFDPTFNDNPNIDVARDIAIPSSKYDIN